MALNRNSTAVQQTIENPEPTGIKIIPQHVNQVSQIADRQVLDRMRVENDVLKWANAIPGSDRHEILIKLNCGKSPDSVFDDMSRKGVHIQSSDKELLRIYSAKMQLAAPGIVISATTAAHVHGAPGGYSTSHGQSRTAEWNNATLAVIDSIRAELNRSLARNAAASSAVAEKITMIKGDLSDLSKAQDTPAFQVAMKRLHDAEAELGITKKPNSHSAPELRAQAIVEALERQKDDLRSEGQTLNSAVALTESDTPNPANPANSTRSFNAVIAEYLSSRNEPLREVPDLPVQEPLANQQLSRTYHAPLMVPVADPGRKCGVPLSPQLEAALDIRGLISGTYEAKGVTPAHMREYASGMERDTSLSAKDLTKASILRDAAVIIDVQRDPLWVAIEAKVRAGATPDELREMANELKVKRDTFEPEGEIRDGSPEGADRSRAYNEWNFRAEILDEEANWRETTWLVMPGKQGLDEPNSGHESNNDGGPNGPGDPPIPGEMVRDQEPPHDYSFSNELPNSGITPELRRGIELSNEIEVAADSTRLAYRRARTAEDIKMIMNILAATAEVAASVGSVPAGGDPSRAMPAIGRGVGSVGERVGTMERHRVLALHDLRAKIKEVTNNAAVQEVTNANQWQETFRDSIENLTKIKVPVIDLDRVERIVASQVANDPWFQEEYAKHRDSKSGEVYRLAIEELASLPDAQLSAAGKKTVGKILNDPSFQAMSYNDIQEKYGKSDPGFQAAFEVKCSAIEANLYNTELKKIVTEKIVNSLKETTSGRPESFSGLLGKENEDLVEQLSDYARSHGYEFVADAFQEKHLNEEAINRSWLQAKLACPLVAHGLAHKGYDPDRVLSEIYGRPDPHVTPARASMEGLQAHFENQIKKNTDQSELENLGIPKGWGGYASGHDIGISEGSHGRNSALLVGFKDDNKMREAMIHFFSREAITIGPNTKGTETFTPEQAKAFASREMLPPPTFFIKIDGKEVLKTEHNKIQNLEETIRGKFQKNLVDSYKEQAENQLHMDAEKYADIKLAGASNFAGLDRQTLVANYRAANENYYKLMATHTAAREEIGPDGTHKIAVALKASETADKYAQNVRKGGDSFKFPPPRLQTDSSPMRAIFGKKGDSVGSDFKRIVENSSASIQALSLDLMNAYERKGQFNLGLMNQNLKHISVRAAQMQEIMDYPTYPQRDSRDRGEFKSTLDSFLKHRGYF